MKSLSATSAAAIALLASIASLSPLAGAGASTEMWLPFVDTYRTLCIDPPPDLRATFEAFLRLRMAG